MFLFEVTNYFIKYLARKSFLELVAKRDAWIHSKKDKEEGRNIEKKIIITSIIFHFLLLFL